MSDIAVTELPFSLADLKELTPHKIPVYPDNQHWLAAMRDIEPAHPEDHKPAEKLMGSLVELEQGVYGFSLPRKCSIFVSERQLIKKQSSARDKAVAKYFRLVQKIAKKLKKPRDKVAQLVARSFENLDVLDPWLEEITAATAELEATDINVATVTVMIQRRLNNQWTEFDTLSLPESLFNVILEYSQQEEAAWKVKKPDEGSTLDAEVVENDWVEVEEEEEEVIQGKLEQPALEAKKPSSTDISNT